MLLKEVSNMSASFKIKVNIALSFYFHPSVFFEHINKIHVEGSPVVGVWIREKVK